MELETIGENAGKVWRTLNEMRGEISIQELSRKINLKCNSKMKKILFDSSTRCHSI